MGKYDFGEWLQSQIGKDYAQIILDGQKAAIKAERGSYGVKGAVNKRESGSIDFAHRVKQFLFFIQGGTKPANVSESDWQAYRQICEMLVENRQFKKEILDKFN